MDPNEAFRREVQQNIARQGSDPTIKRRTAEYIAALDRYYSYNFSWLGRPIIQFPQDLLAMQELIWRVKPDLIFETGVAHGGSLIFHASILELLGGEGQVLGVDIDLRLHNWGAIVRHPLYHRITLLEGSSVDPSIAEKVHEFARHKQRVMVCLDSNHTHDHVLKELELYAPLTSLDSYCVVFDTIIEDMPEEYYHDRPWGKGNNPKTAVHAYLQTTDCFEIDHSIENKLLITVAPDGYLRRVR